ncbi:hypothetical protein BJ508DRAFT_19228 [Ascobolus immersus RN42]|uniref:Uncharacterized protein n=1 Tax=Ascobolus immersus RN42 TaxID=1160509 RepID=A0A3N4HQ46_ASCIM|nr:hypothetical protein BJ508DRAFT_19228 [Ascobolus immersus RN42]
MMEFPTETSSGFGVLDGPEGLRSLKTCRFACSQRPNTCRLSEADLLEWARQNITLLPKPHPAKKTSQSTHRQKDFLKFNHRNRPISTTATGCTMATSHAIVPATPGTGSKKRDASKSPPKDPNKNKQKKPKGSGPNAGRRPRAYLLQIIRWTSTANLQGADANDWPLTNAVIESLPVPDNLLFRHVNQGHLALRNYITQNAHMWWNDGDQNDIILTPSNKSGRSGHFFFAFDIGPDHPHQDAPVRGQRVVRRVIRLGFTTLPETSPLFVEGDPGVQDTRIPRPPAPAPLAPVGAAIPPGGPAPVDPVVPPGDPAPVTDAPSTNTAPDSDAVTSTNAALDPHATSSGTPLAPIAETTDNHSSVEPVIAGLTTGPEHEVEEGEEDSIPEEKKQHLQENVIGQEETAHEAEENDEDPAVKSLQSGDLGFVPQEKEDTGVEEVPIDEDLARTRREETIQEQSASNETPQAEKEDSEKITETPAVETGEGPKLVVESDDEVAPEEPGEKVEEQDSVTRDVVKETVDHQGQTVGASEITVKNKKDGPTVKEKEKARIELSATISCLRFIFDGQVTEERCRQAGVEKRSALGAALAELEEELRLAVERTDAEFEGMRSAMSGNREE